MRLPSKGGAAMLLTFRGLPEVSCLDDQESARDRKSTRLNSSHGYISYAVFCLKKKKRQHADTDKILARAARPLPQIPDQVVEDKPHRPGRATCLACLPRTAQCPGQLTNMPQPP